MSHAGHETQAHSPPSQPKSPPCASLRPHASGRATPSGCEACAAPSPTVDAMIDSPEDYCGRHHVCRGIWGGVRHPLFFWLVWQHIPGGPLHASSPASAVLARPWRCDLGRRHSGMLLSPTLSAREVRVACPLDCPRHPHCRVRQARGGRRHSRRVLPSDRPDTKRGGSRHSRRVLPSARPDTKSKRGQTARTGRWQAPGGRGADLVG